MRMSVLSAMLAARAIFWSGVGHAAWTFFPMDRQASGLRVAASMKRTCPERKERMAWEPSFVKKIMWGRRTAFLVASWQSVLTSPARSMVSFGLAFPGAADR